MWMACCAGQAQGPAKFATFKKFALKREKDALLASHWTVSLESALGLSPPQRKPMAGVSQEDLSYFPRCLLRGQPSGQAAGAPASGGLCGVWGRGELLGAAGKWGLCSQHLQLLGVPERSPADRRAVNRARVQVCGSETGMPGGRGTIVNGKSRLWTRLHGIGVAGLILLFRRPHSFSPAKGADLGHATPPLRGLCDQDGPCSLPFGWRSDNGFVRSFIFSVSFFF